MKIFLSLFAFFSAINFVSAQGHGTIIVEVDQIENNSGDIKAGLYRDATGFPDDVSKAYKVSTAKIKDGKSMLVFEGVEFGSYVLAAFHDENGNKQLDKNTKGVPIEALGMSNNVKLKLGPPKFETALFEFKEPKTTLQLSLQKYRTKPAPDSAK
jgi:uncharacterized protein (DUF2141 family)